MANGSEPIKDADGSKFVQVYIYYAAETEKFIERRAATSRYFLTISSALVAILGVVLKYNPAGQSLWLVSLAAAGILVCALWWRIVRSYSVLTGARFGVIQAMEKRLPASPYTDEWNLVANSGKFRGYRSISALEAWIPWVFAAIYAVLLGASLIVGSGTAYPAPPGP